MKEIKRKSIPTSFIKYLKTIRNNTTTAILNKGCRKWPVKIIDWAFREGWEDFVTENGIQELDIVVFNHQGNMVFDTMVFDDSLCQKEYQTDQVTESSFGLDLNTKHVMVETESLNSYPYFVTTLKQQDGNQKCIYLPVKFAVANGLRTREMILTCAENEGSWTVHLTNHKDKFFYIRGLGFSDFCFQNGLEKGDSFKFMLIQNGEKPVVIISRLTKVLQIKTEGVLDPCLQMVDFPATPSSPVDTAPGPLLSPYFKSTVKANDIKRSFVNVPMGFARANGLFGKNCEMVVMDEKQRLWPTRLCCGRDVYIRGIRDMWVANGLKEGDEFLFKLVDNAQKPQMTLHRLPKILPIKTEGVLEPHVQKVDFPATPSSPVHAASGPLLSPYFKSTATAYLLYI